jgi:ABC-type nitrate/sulfonate/bicarbonate transport system substrate-binding protein
MGHQRFLALTLVVGLVAACSSAATPAPATQAPASQAPATAAAASTPAASAAPATATPLPFAGVTLRVAKSGGNAIDDVSIGYWIQELKDKYGITVQLDNTAAPDVSLRAVVAGAVDVAVAMNLTGVLRAVQNAGADMKVIALDTYASDYQLLSKSSIATIAALKGKVFGISAVGDSGELIPHICLNDLGFDYSTLKLVQGLGTSAVRVAALLAGTVDVTAVHLVNADSAVAKANGTIKILQDCGVAVGNYPVSGMSTTGAWLSANKTEAQAIVDAYMDAMRWAASNKDAYLKFAQTWVPDVTPADANTSYDYFVKVGEWPVNGGMDAASIQTYIGYLAQTQTLIGKIPTSDKWLDDSFVNDYLARNGKK